jgi:hypothetical protein
MSTNAAHQEVAEDMAPLSEGRAAYNERERVIAVERGLSDIRAGRVIDDDEFGRQLDEQLGPLE